MIQWRRRYLTSSQANSRTFAGHFGAPYEQSEPSISARLDWAETTAMNGSRRRLR
jgi:hypothetical protein